MKAEELDILQGGERMRIADIRKKRFGDEHFCPASINDKDWDILGDVGFLLRMVDDLANRANNAEELLKPAFARCMCGTCKIPTTAETLIDAIRYEMIARKEVEEKLAKIPAHVRLAFELPVSEEDDKRVTELMRKVREKKADVDRS